MSDGDSLLLNLRGSLEVFRVPHPTASEIINLVQSSEPIVSDPQLYVTVNDLIREGLLRVNHSEEATTILGGTEIVPPYAIT